MMKDKVRRFFYLVPLALLFITIEEYSHNEFTSKSSSLSSMKEQLTTRKRVLPIKLAGARFCDGSNATHPCIFDLGLHKGQDTLLYLTHDSARVLAVDANGAHIVSASQMFSEQVRQNRLYLVHAAVGEKRDTTATFWVNHANDAFSSLNETLGCRDAAGNIGTAQRSSYCTPVLVEAQRCIDLIARHGTPHYLKCDVEGMDRACLRSLHGLPQQLLPSYMSFSGVHNEDVDELVRMGYRRFKVVNQAVIDATAPMEGLRGNSGPWGEAASDVWSGEKWHDANGIKKKLPLPKSVVARGKVIAAWYDLHAAF